MQIDAVSATSPDRLPGPSAPDTVALRAVAQDLEAAFLSEMLKHSGLGSAGGPGGGPGTDQFASLLRNEQARLFAERGGIGLAESIFRALVARSDGAAAAPGDGPVR